MTRLLLLPQRYIFSSKSQRGSASYKDIISCCCYHKGTYFQANHNPYFNLMMWSTVVVATTKVHIFKQITTHVEYRVITLALLLLPQRYIFSSKSQQELAPNVTEPVVVATTKVHIFKQITTVLEDVDKKIRLLLLPQRYIFSSKSQQDFLKFKRINVVVATTKVHIFKQITTRYRYPTR